MRFDKLGCEYSAYIDVNKTKPYQIIFSKEKDFHNNLVSSEDKNLEKLTDSFLGNKIAIIGAGIGNLPIELSKKGKVLIIDKFDYNEGKELLDDILKKNKDKRIIDRANVLIKRVNKYFNSENIKVIQTDILDIPKYFENLKGNFNAVIDKFGPLTYAKYINKDKKLERKIRNAEEFLLNKTGNLYLI